MCSVLRLPSAPPSHVLTSVEVLPSSHGCSKTTYNHDMKRNSTTARLLATVSLVIAGLTLTGARSASAEDLGSTDFDVALNIAGIAQSAVSIGALNCSDGSRTFASTGEMMVGLATDPRIQTQLDMVCKPTLNIDSGIKTISGTMSIPSKGVTDGVFTAECSAKSNMAVTANVSVGASVPGLLSVNVSSASAPLALGCTFKGSSAQKGTDVFGTIEGFADVIGMCSSACVSLGLTATATVTAATGELKGQTGTGSYTYSDAFEIPELASIADRLAQMKGKSRVRDQRVSCPEGAEDCTIYDSNPCPNGEDSCKISTGSSPSFTCPSNATCTTVQPVQGQSHSGTLSKLSSRPSAKMRVVLASKAGPTVILRPQPLNQSTTSILSPGQPLTISGSVSSKCTIRFVGKKVVQRSLDTSSNGSASVTYSSSQLNSLIKQLGFLTKSKTKPIATVSAVCVGSSGSAVEKIQLGS